MTINTCNNLRKSGPNAVNGHSHSRRLIKRWWPLEDVTLMMGPLELWPWRCLPGGRGGTNSGREAGRLLPRFNRDAQTTNYNINLQYTHIFHVNLISCHLSCPINHLFHLPFTSPSCLVFSTHSFPFLRILPHQTTWQPVQLHTLITQIAQ